MSSVSWEEYAKSEILRFRKEFEKYADKYNESVRKSRWVFLTSLNEPCQVVVIDPGKGFPKGFFVIHDSEYPDMKIIVYENMAIKAILTGISKENPRWVEIVRHRELIDLLGRITVTRYSKDRFAMVEVLEGVGLVITTSVDLRYEDADTALSLCRSALRATRSGLETQEQKEAIEETVGNLKKDVKSIPKEVEFRNRIVEATQRLEEQIKQLHGRLETEVGSMRQLIGTSEKYQEWKVLVSEVNALKRTPYVSKELFDTETKRLDQRIDSLKEIKFWSKRTTLDIVLAMIATASTIIAALLAMGILKF